MVVYPVFNYHNSSIADRGYIKKYCTTLKEFQFVIIHMQGCPHTGREWSAPAIPPLSNFYHHSGLFYHHSQGVKSAEMLCLVQFWQYFSYKFNNHSDYPVENPDTLVDHIGP